MVTIVFGIFAVGSNGSRYMEDTKSSKWTLQVVYFMLSLLVVLVAHKDKSSILKVPNETNKQIQPSQSEDDIEPCRMSLWFISCLIGIYLHALLLVAIVATPFVSPM